MPVCSGGVNLLTQKNLKKRDPCISLKLNILIDRFVLDLKRFFISVFFSTACLLRSFLFIREVHL
jgi:hypothetical protein